MKVLKPNISFCFDLKRFFIHTFMLKGKSAIRGDSMWSLVSKEKDLFQLVLRASQCVNFLCSFETRNEESKSKTRLANVLIFQVVGFGSTQHFHSPEVQKCSKVFAPRRTVPCPTSFAEINEAFNNVYSAMHQLDFSISFFNCRLQCQVLASFNDSWIESKCSSPIVGLIDRNCFWRNDSLDVFIQLVSHKLWREHFNEKSPSLSTWKFSDWKLLNRSWMELQEHALQPKDEELFTTYHDFHLDRKLFIITTEAYYGNAEWNFSRFQRIVSLRRINSSRKLNEIIKLSGKV